MQIEILSSPYSHGTTSSELALGPAAVTRAGLVEVLRSGGHDVTGPYVATAPASVIGDEMEVITAAGSDLARLVRVARERNTFCLVLEGNCTAAPAVVAGLGHEGRVGLLWIDSHGDFNTPQTTPSGMLGGMPVAICTGRCHPDWRQAVGLVAPLRDEDVVLAGIRDLDSPERAALDASAVEVIEANGDTRSEAERLATAVARLARQTDLLYVHLDVDVLNPDAARGFNLPVPGGPDAEELAEMVALAMRAGTVAALGIAAYNSSRDADGRTVRAILHMVEAACIAAPDGVAPL